MPSRGDIHARFVSGKVRIHRWSNVFFPAASLATCTTFTRLGGATRAHTFFRLQGGGEAPKKWAEKRQRVINATACTLTQTKKYDRWLIRVHHNDLHFLDVPERNQLKLCVHVYMCLHGIAPKNMMDLCRPVFGFRETQSPALSGERET